MEAGTTHGNWVLYGKEASLDGEVCMDTQNERLISPLLTSLKRGPEEEKTQSGSLMCEWEKYSYKLSYSKHD